ncbi:hypothetical protein Fmac_023798 [Flemingia macrophylla]|uniref:Uncharacterized protein n=1 Tax=Flemingia macrophylla TaxID=520843 RepID=A0ABD1LP77_9FABA
MGDSNVTENHQFTTSSQQTEDGACLSAMLLNTSLVYHAVLNAAVDLNLFEIIAKGTTPGGSFMSSHEIAAKLETHHPDLPNRLDRILRLLASYSLLTSSTRTTHHGATEIVYGLSPVGNYFVPNGSRGCIASSTTYLFYPAMLQVLLNLKEALVDADIDLFKRAYGAVCHNWSYEKCLAILSNCHKALSPNGKVVVVEFILPEEPEPTEESQLVSSLDNLMFITDGGRERTQKQYENLCKLSGFSKFQVACRAFSCLGMTNNRRNNELTEVVQAIREMAAALLQQGNNGGNNGGHMETQ